MEGVSVHGIPPPRFHRYEDVGEKHEDVGVNSIPSPSVRPNLTGSVKSDESSSTVPTLCIKAKGFSKEAFYVQAILIYIICIACIINLSIGSEHSSVWVSLLSASLGYILPSPKIRGPQRNTLIGVTREVAASS